MSGRIGMLGGTFDPPHVGHAIVAQDVLEALGLDLLLVVPAAHPPHRTAVLPGSVRYELVRKLFDGVVGVEASDLELRRPGPSYTVDTLAQINGDREPDELFCIMGSDQFAILDTWQDFQRLSELARVVVMTRGRDEERILSGKTAATGPTEGRGGQRNPGVPHTTVRVTRVDVSSTCVRRRLRAGKTIRFLVPEMIRAQVERAWAELPAP